jgi:hypothetical protein
MNKFVTIFLLLAAVLGCKTRSSMVMQSDDSDLTLGARAAVTPHLNACIQKLVDWENGANAGRSYRNTEPFWIEHYELPPSYPDGSELGEFVSGWDPGDLFQSMLIVGEGPSQRVRYFLNPEDRHFRQKVIENFKAKGLNIEIQKKRFVGFTTASRSVIAIDTNTGMVFSTKSSTNRVQGVPQKKAWGWQESIEIAALNNAIAQLQGKGVFKTVDYQKDVFFTGIGDMDLGTEFRELPGLKECKHYLLPGFAAMNEQLGAEIAEKNGSKDPSQFWQTHYAEPLGKAVAEHLAFVGLANTSPHSQNFLIELNKDFAPTGKIFFRDFGDAFAQMAFLRAQGAEKIVEIYSKIDTLRKEDNVEIGVGFLHLTSETPRWMDDDKYKQWGQVFFSQFELKLQKITKFPPSFIARAGDMYSSNGSRNYLVKKYLLGPSEKELLRQQSPCLKGQSMNLLGEICSQ